MSETIKMQTLCQNNKSRDFFDPEKAFFLIDSEHLDEVKPHFYGFSVQASGIYEQENLTPTAAGNLDGCGAYVYVERIADDQIRIRQDINGSWGIYLYRNGDYFALSSSFHRLLEYLKCRFPLTLDRDYANFFLLAGLCSHSYSETAVKEIKLVDKDAVLFIDTKAAKLRIEVPRHVEESIELDTPEGIAVLDHWFDKWTTMFRNLKARTSNIQVSLSGGFDSRLTFLLMLCSGVDLNDIQVYSIHDTLHTHAEDYEIASEIADYYGFKLNNKKFDRRAIHYSLKDSINLSFYTKLTTHKQMFFKTVKFQEKRYIVPGTGGAGVRPIWHQPERVFIDQQAHKAERYSSYLAQEMAISTEKIHQAAFQAVEEKFGMDPADSTRYSTRFYRLTRCRHHFGKEAVERLLGNEYELTPLMDPNIRKLKLETAECQDRNLLIALIYVRYCPQLLNFRFEGGRSIRPETIACAQRINEAFPFIQVGSDAKQQEPFSVITRDETVLKILQRKEDNRVPPKGASARYLKSVFDSCGFQKLFATCFDEEIYTYAKRYAEEKDFQPMQECYAVIGITKVIGDVMASRQLCQPTVTQCMDRFVEENVYEPDDLAELVGRYKKDLTGRVELKLGGVDANYVLEWVSDGRAAVLQPKWLQEGGVGYAIEAYHGTLDLRLRIQSDGELTVRLCGKKERDAHKKKTQHWVVYQNVLYNGEEALSGAQMAWYRKPVTLTRTVKAGETVTLHLEWEPCRYTAETEEYLKKQVASLKKKNEAQETQLNALHRSVSFRVGSILTWPLRKMRKLLTKLRGRKTGN